MKLILTSAKLNNNPKSFSLTFIWLCHNLLLFGQALTYLRSNAQVQIKQQIVRKINAHIIIISFIVQ